MFEYDLTGKLAILVLDQAILPALAQVGVSASPIVARIYKMETAGLWLDSPSFNLCPVGTKKIYTAGGIAICHAHVFIPAAAIVSVAVFPDNNELEIPKDSLYQRIGFIPPQKN